MDLLGEIGRRAMTACVKVSIYKKMSAWRRYKKEEAINEVQDCFLENVDLEDWNREPEETLFDIMDIYDRVTNLENMGSNSRRRKCDKKLLEMLRKQRKKIEDEYNAYTKEEMMHYGSGTVIHNRFVITRRNVVEIVLLDNGNDYSIFISNERTENELFCKVIYDDEAKDLALLHCPRLSASDISPLQLSHEAQKVGFNVFCFGYPNNYHETEALCVNGMISQIPQERQGSMVLCSTGLNHCLSGGPVLLRDDCGIIMIGIVKERCIEEVLSSEDEEVVAQLTEERTVGYSGNSDEARLEQIYHKLIAASNKYPYGFTNAIMGATIQEFLNMASETYEGRDCGELKELTVNMQSASSTTC